MKNNLLAILMLLCPLIAQAAPCPYPANPINWVMRYCAMVAESDDLIVIQRTACFKEAMKDLLPADPCAVKEKYKTKICQDYLMETKKYKSVEDCVKNADIEPYNVG